MADNPVTFHTSDNVLRYGAYVCLQLPPDSRSWIADTNVDALAKDLSLQNEYEARNGHPSDAIAFLSCLHVTSADIGDNRLAGTDSIVHVASAKQQSVEHFCSELVRMVGQRIQPYILKGVVRPKQYTGGAMEEFAYAHQVMQQPGRSMPNAFLVPMSKTADWWSKNWMERHTYFLPRYDDHEKMINEGHALAASAGIACLMRRTYRYETEPAPEGAYDFVNYFECSDADIPTFRAVCAALRDLTKNPEWKFVREGPTWHGRRVATWKELFA